MLDLFGVQPGDAGDAGNLTIKTAQLLVRDGAIIDAGTFGSGKGGNLNVTAADTIEVIGTSADGNFPSSLFTSSAGSGDAGDLTIETAQLLVRDGAQIGASTFGSGRGGNLNVTATDTIEVISQSANGNFASGLFAQTQGSEDAGDLTIETARLLLEDGAQIGAGTFGSGKGGNLNVTATDTIKVIGTSADGQFASGLFASSESGSTGDAGDLNVNSNTLLINQGKVSVESNGAGNAGDLNINANSLRLDNNAIVSANTQSVNKDPSNPQANININSRDLILRRNSNITTNATKENVIGGNINIDAGAIGVFEQSRISANSSNFRGGRVTINTQGLFGTQLWYPETLKGFITATGATPLLSGEVQVNTQIDPSSGLIELPVNLVDAANQISNACTPGGSQFDNEFSITGRGGLPISPTEPLQETNTLQAWVKLKPQTTNTTIKLRPRTTSNNNKVTQIKQIVEATGWIVDKDGNIEFVADANRVNPRNHSQTPADCKVSG